MRRNAIAVMLTAFSILLQPATYPICLACLVFWMLWEFNILGGADAKLLIAETLIVGTPWFYLPVAVVGGIQGIIAGFRRQKDIPFVVAISCGTLLFLFFQQEYVWGKGI